jgi:hypothetical protein
MTITQLPPELLSYILNLTGQPARTRLVCRLFNEVSDSDVLSAAYRISPHISDWIPASILTVLKAAPPSDIPGAHKALVKRTACCIFRIANYAGVRYSIDIRSGSLEMIIGGIKKILQQVRSTDFESIEMARPLEEASYEADNVDLLALASYHRDQDALEVLIANTPIQAMSLD